MQSPALQRGFLLIVAVILIAVAAVMAAVIVTMTAGSGQAGGGHAESARALFIAESGLEKGIRQRSLSNAYAGEGPTAMGQGSYTINVFNTDFSGAALPSGQRRIRSVGTIGNATRTVEAIVRTGAAMMVYAKESPAASVGVPFFRQWDNDTYTWGAEGQANDVGPNILFMVLKFARTRDEAILGVQDSNGAITIQVWNGTVWSAPVLTCSTGGALAGLRGFDIEYENTSDRAILVCNNNVANQASWGMWDGTALTFPAGTVGLATIGVPRWIEMTSSPAAGSDEIALIALGLPNATADVYGVRWTGTTWSNMAVGATWDPNAATSGTTTRVIDVAYERNTGRAMFIWGSQTNGFQYYRIWDGTTLSGANLLLDLTNIPGPDMTGEAIWLKLVSNPNPASNQLLYAVQDDQRDLFTALWNGAAWVSQTRQDGNLEDSGDRNFDIVFETHPNNPNSAWLVWGTRAGSDFTNARRWDGATSSWLGGGPIVAGAQEAAFTRLEAHPSSGAIFALVYEDSSSPTDDIAEYHLTEGGAAWVATAPPIWGGNVVGNPVRQRIALATERRTPIIAWREVFP